MDNGKPGTRRPPREPARGPARDATHEHTRQPNLEQPTDRMPEGYRPALVTAITVFLGFSIALLRFWSFEAAGEWSAASVTCALLVCAGVVLQIFALYRSLELRDQAPARYRLTVHLFFAGLMIAIGGAAMSSVVAAIEGSSVLSRK